MLLRLLFFAFTIMAVVAAQHARDEPQPDRNQHYRHRETTTFIPIIRYDKEQGTDGSYKASYETGNNIIAQEEGYIKDLGPDPDAEGQHINAQVQQGSYTYTSPEGNVYTINYVADERGFHAHGDHLPTPPPVSAEIQKGLDIIYASIAAREEEQERKAQQNPQNYRPLPEDDGRYRNE